MSDEGGFKRFRRAIQWSWEDEEDMDDETVCWKNVERKNIEGVRVRVYGRSIRTNNNAEGEPFLLFNSKCHFRLFNIAFHSRFNRRVQVSHPNIWSFIKVLQGEENRFHHMYVQFSAGLGSRPKQAKTIAIQRRIDNLGQRYYDGCISAMEYLEGLSFTVAKQKK